MKKLSIFIVNLVLVFGLSNAVIAQDSDKEEASHQVNINITTLALIDIESSNSNTTISLEPSAPTEAGTGYNFSNTKDESLWLNYSSIVKSGNSRKITASIDADGGLPTGITLAVQAKNAAGTGKGKLGTAINNPVTLSTKPASIITGIGSSYTGDGPSNGHNLTYTLNLDNDQYETLLADTYTVNVTYTITDEK